MVKAPLRVYAPRDFIEAKAVSPNKVRIIAAMFPGPRESAISWATKHEKAALDFRDRLLKSGINLVDQKDRPQHLGENDFCLNNCLPFSEQTALVKVYAPEVQAPNTVDYYTFEANPFFPVVAKEPGLDEGSGIFFIETSEQWGKFKSFIENVTPFYKKIFVFQEYILTPSERFTSFRVMVDATGSVLASSLIYSGHEKSTEETDRVDIPFSELEQLGANLLDQLRHPASPYYLAARKMFSNCAQGGGLITLNPRKLTTSPQNKMENGLLTAHGIDPVTRKLPPVLSAAASTLGRTLVKEQALYAGLDFVPEAETGRHLFMESNPTCGLLTYAAAKSLREADYVVQKETVLDEVLRNLLAHAS